MIHFRSLLRGMTQTHLSERYQNRRSQICQVNIKVNFIAWIVEFFGCMTIAIDFTLVGSRNNAVTGLLKTLTLFAYFVVLPCTFLVNCSAGINTIVDNSWTDAIGRIFQPVKENDSKIASVKASLKEKSSSISTISGSVRDNPTCITKDQVQKVNKALAQDIMIASSRTSKMKHVAREAWKESNK